MCHAAHGRQNWPVEQGFDDEVLADGRAVGVGCDRFDLAGASVESKGIAGDQRVGAGKASC
jgi:hypothetical protein